MERQRVIYFVCFFFNIELRPPMNKYVSKMHSYIDV